jgi:hypothetical protein
VADSRCGGSDRAPALSAADIGVAIGAGIRLACSRAQKGSLRFWYLHLNEEPDEKCQVRAHDFCRSDDVPNQITAATLPPVPDTVGPSYEIRHLVHLRVKVRRRKAISGYPELPDMS